MNIYSFYIFLSFIILLDILLCSPPNFFRFRADNDDLMVQGALTIAKKEFRDLKGNSFTIIPIGVSYRIARGYYFKVELLVIMEERVSFLYQCYFFVKGKREMNLKEYTMKEDITTNERNRISFHKKYYFVLNNIIKEEVRKKEIELDYIDNVENFRFMTKLQYDFELFIVNVRCNNEPTKRIFIVEKFENKFTLIGELSDLIKMYYKQ